MNALVSENTGLRDEVVHLNDVLKQVASETESEGDILPCYFTRGLYILPLYLFIGFFFFDYMKVSRVL